MGNEKKKYDKYWGNVMNINQLLFFGVILDPRYKLKYIEWSFLGMYSNDKQFALTSCDSVKAKLTKMYDWYVAVHDKQHEKTQSHGGLGGSSIGQTTAPAEISRRDAFRAHLEEKSYIDQKNELETYLAEANIDADEGFELLGWWQQNSSRFPILSMMVKDVLATPVSTVASESAFSTGGRVLDSFRSSLNSEMVEALICAQNWLRPSLVQCKEVNPSEELEVSENIITGFQRGASKSQGAGHSTTKAGTGDGGVGSPSVTAN